jgi:DNA-binding HxlR family transcriptional regulator
MVAVKEEFSSCPVETTLMIIGNRWKVLIIRDLMGGTRRFTELKKSINGITQKALTVNLRDMEAKGLLMRKVYPVVPPKVEYTLTETGYSLKSVLDALAMWGTEYKCLYESKRNE